MHILKILINAVALIFKTPGLLIGLLHHRHAGARAFQQELLRAGIKAKQADALTDSYKSMLLPEWWWLKSRG